MPPSNAKQEQLSHVLDERDLILLYTPYKELIGKDIFAFLNSFVKPEESDPLHKWIGTHKSLY